MDAITLRNLPPRVARAVRDRAKKERISLNRAVASLLEERVVGPAHEPAGAPYHDLDFLYETWTTDEAEAFDKSLKAQRRIDPDLWR